MPLFLPCLTGLFHGSVESSVCGELFALLLSRFTLSGSRNNAFSGFSQIENSTAQWDLSKLVHGDL